MLIGTLVLICIVSECHNLYLSPLSKCGDLPEDVDTFYKSLSDAAWDDTKLLVPELVKKRGYPCQTHTVTTSDGYILTMHRIPHGRDVPTTRRRPVAYVQHGILSSSADWLLAGPERALGYILADAGYDVWLANSRGNRYSRRHKELDPKDKAFWDFSWHDIGVKDLPANIDYILNETGQEKLFYVGHSQGTTIFYVLCSEKPEYNEKIQLHVSLSPIAFMKYMTSPLLNILAFLYKYSKLPQNCVGEWECLPKSSTLALFGKLFCAKSAFSHVVCTNSLFVLAGFNEKQMNKTLLPVVMAHTPAGASIKQIWHYLQTIMSGEFQKWDHGSNDNKIAYNSSEPPHYQLTKITAPIYLYYSRNDWLSNEIDVNRLEMQLKNLKKKILVSDPNFNHLDYLYAINAREVLYDPMIKIMANYHQKYRRTC